MSNVEKELSCHLTEKFHEFLVQHSPSAFSRLLRRMVLEYIIYRHRLGFPVDFKNHVLALSDLFDLLDEAAEEYEPGREENEQ